MRILLLIAAALLTVAGCGSAAAAAPADPASLVGWWRVAGTDQRVLIDPDAVEVLDGCATHTGTWRADPDGRFVAVVDATQPCPDGSTADVPVWVAAAGGFRVEGDDRVLLDRGGVEAARLVPEPPFAGPGSVDPARATGGRAALTPAAPAPSGGIPADPGALAGRWNTTGTAYVEFAADGTWSGSDGCNGTGGSWTAGTDGGFLAITTAVSTLIACDTAVDVGSQVGNARYALLDDTGLVLLDDAAVEIARYSRA